MLPLGMGFGGVTTGGGDAARATETNVEADRTDSVASLRQRYSKLCATPCRRATAETFGYLNRVHSSRRLASHGILTASTRLQGAHSPDLLSPLCRHARSAETPNLQRLSHLTKPRNGEAADISTGSAVDNKFRRGLPHHGAECVSV